MTKILKMKLSKTLLFFILGLLVITAFWRFLDRPQNLSEPDIPTNQKLQCVSYAPFRDKEAPYQLDSEGGLKFKRENIAEDMALLATHSECVRTYSVTGLDDLPELVKKHGMKLLLGIWIGRDAKANELEIANAIAIAKQYPEIIRAMVVGNEVLLRREQTVSDMITLIQKVKNELPTIPITYADVWEFWLLNPGLQNVVDFITIHILPYWENHPTGINDAIAHVKTVHAKITAAFPNKDIFIGESGWPSEGRVRGEAVPSLKNEARFLRGFVSAANAGAWNYNLIEAFDQPWKRMNEGAVGGYWGIFSADRHDKGLQQGAVGIFPDATLWLILALVLFCVIFIFTKNSGMAIAFAISQSFWWREAFICNRFSDEWILTGVVSLVAILWCSKIKEKFLPLLLLITCIIAIRTGLGLTFDARYRMLPWSGFFAPLVLASITLSQIKIRQEQNLWLAYGLALAVLAITILINETVFNIPAVIFVILLLLFAMALIKNTELTRDALNRQTLSWRGFLSTLAFFVVLATALAVRYGLMEADTLSATCADGNAIGLCGVRAQIGMLIHFRVWAWLSLLPLFAGIMMRQHPWHHTLLILGFILAPLGLVLYNVNLASWSFVLGLGMIATKVPQQLPPRAP